MTITSLLRKSGSAKFSMNNEGKIIRTYSQPLLVESTLDLDEYQLGLALGYQPGQSHPTDPFATLRDMSVDRIDTTVPYVKFDIVLNYSTDGPAPQNNSEDPTQQRVKKQWQTTEQTIYIVRDKNGDPIVNAADQPFEGGVPVAVALPTLVYERNESSFSGAIMTAYANSLNRYSFSGAAPKTLRLKISATEEFEGTFEYWKVRYEMAYQPDGWQPRPVNAGLYQLVSGELVRCRDRDRQEVTQPVPLNEDGSQVDISDLPDGLNYTDVNFYPLVDFSGLGLSEA